MELLKALDQLAHSMPAPPSSGAPSSGGSLPLHSLTSSEKIKACRTVVSQLLAPSQRQSQEFGRFLQISITTLLRVHADPDLGVWSVAEESLNTIIKRLINTQHERILFELYKGIKAAPEKVGDSSRPQRAALLKFAETCRYIREDKCRKYATSLQQYFCELLDGERPAESLMDSLGLSMEKICAHLMPYLDRDETDALIVALLRHIDDSVAAVRRAVTKSLAAVIAHASDTKRLVGTVLNKLLHLLNSAHNHEVGGHSEAGAAARTVADELDSAAVKEPSSETVSTNAAFLSGHFMQGALYLALKLVRLSVRRGRGRSLSEHLIVPHLRCVGALLLRGMLHPSHNVMGLALEVLQECAANYGVLRTVWHDVGFVRVYVQLLQAQVCGESVAVAAAPLLDILRQRTPLESTERGVVRADTSEASHEAILFTKVSVTASSLLSLAQLAKNYARDVEHGVDGSMSPLLTRVSALAEHADPLVRGNVAYLCSSLLSGRLCSAETSDADAQRLLLNTIMRVLRDESSVAVKQAVVAVAECIGDVLDSDQAIWGLAYLRELRAHLLSGDQYWVVTAEILNVVASLDYAALQALESSVRHGGDWSAKLSADILEFAVDGPTWFGFQESLLQGTLEAVAHADARVRSAAVDALVRVVPHLYFASPLSSAVDAAPATSVRIEEAFALNADASHSVERVDTPLAPASEETLVTAHRSSSGVLGSGARSGPDARKTYWNLSHVLRRLTRIMCMASDKNQLRGGYAALQALVNSYPMFSSRQTSDFVAELVPLMLERFTSTWAAADLDAQRACLHILRNLCPPPPSPSSSSTSALASASGGSAGGGGGGTANGSVSETYGHLHAVMRHVLRILHILSLVALGRPSSHREPRLHANLRPPHGAFAQWHHLIKLFDRLSGAHKASLTDSKLIDNKFSELRHVAMRALLATVSSLQRACAVYTDEILFHLQVHLDEEACLVTQTCRELMLYCVRELDDAVLSDRSRAVSRVEPRHVVSVRRSASRLRSSTLGSTRASGAASGADAHGSLYALLFADGARHHALAVPTAPSLRLDLTLDARTRQRVTQNSENRALMRRFEPFLVRAMRMYSESSRVLLRGAILQLLSAYVRFGFDLRKVPEADAFIEHVTQQLSEIRPAHEAPNTVRLFSPLFHFLVTLHHHGSERDDGEQVLHVCAGASQFIITHWARCAEAELGDAFISFVHILFSPRLAQYRVSAAQRDILPQLRTTVVDQLLSVARDSPSAVRLLRVAYRQSQRIASRATHESAPEAQLLGSVSRRIVEALLPESLAANGVGGVELVRDTRCAADLLHLYALLTTVETDASNVVQRLMAGCAPRQKDGDGDEHNEEDRLDPIKFVLLLRVLCAHGERELAKCGVEAARLLQRVMSLCTRTIVAANSQQRWPKQLRRHVAYHALHFTTHMLAGTYATDESAGDDGDNVNAASNVSPRVGSYWQRAVLRDEGVLVALDELCASAFATQCTLLCVATCKLLMAVSTTRGERTWSRLALTTPLAHSSLSWNASLRADCIFLAYCHTLHDEFTRVAENYGGNADSATIDMDASLVASVCSGTFVDNLIGKAHDSLVDSCVATLCARVDAFEAFVLKHLDEAFDSHTEPLPVPRQHKMLRLLQMLPPSASSVRLLERRFLAVQNTAYALRISAFKLVCAMCTHIDTAELKRCGALDALCETAKRIGDATHLSSSPVLVEQRTRALALIEAARVRAQALTDASGDNTATVRELDGPVPLMTSEEANASLVALRSTAGAASDRLLAAIAKPTAASVADLLPECSMTRDMTLALHLALDDDGGAAALERVRLEEVRAVAQLFARKKVTSAGTRHHVGAMLVRHCRALWSTVASLSQSRLAPAHELISVCIEVTRCVYQVLRDTDDGGDTDAQPLTPLLGLTHALSVFGVYARALITSAPGIVESVRVATLCARRLCVAQPLMSLVDGNDEAAQALRRYLLMLYDVYFMLSLEKRAQRRLRITLLGDAAPNVDVRDGAALLDALHAIFMRMTNVRAESTLRVPSSLRPVRDALLSALTTLLGGERGTLWPVRHDMREGDELYVSLRFPYQSLGAGGGGGSGGGAELGGAGGGGGGAAAETETESVLLSTSNALAPVLREGQLDARALTHLFDQLLPLLTESYANELSEQGVALALSVLRSSLAYCVEHCVRNRTVELLHSDQLAQLDGASVRRGRSRSIPVQERERTFLHTEHGRKLHMLHSMIDERINYDDGNGGGGGDEKETVTVGGALSVEEIVRGESMRWRDIDLRHLWARLRPFFDATLSESCGSVYLRHEAIRTAVLVSDLFECDTFEWLADALMLCWRDAERTDDFLMQSQALPGLCKCVAVLEYRQAHSAPPSAASPLKHVSTPGAATSTLKSRVNMLAHGGGSNTPQSATSSAASTPGSVSSYASGTSIGGADSQLDVPWLCAALRHALQSAHSSTRIAAWRGLVYLIEADVQLLTLLPNAFESLLTLLARSHKEAPATEIVAGLRAAFLLIERFPTQTALFTSDFTRLALQLGASDTVPIAVLRAVCDGFGALCTSFALSDTLAHSVAQFALNRYARSDCREHLHALALIVACMYTDRAETRRNAVGAQESASPESAAPDAIPMGNMERVKLLFAEVRHGAPEVAAVSVDVLPRLLLDFFALDEMLLFVLGQFVRQRSMHWCTAHVIRHVFGVVAVDEERRAQLLHWVLVCMPNVAQVQPHSLSIWMQCVIALSTQQHADALVALLDEVLRSASFVDINVYLLAMRAMYDDRHSVIDVRDSAFSALFERTDVPHYVALKSLCEQKTGAKTASEE